jgi:hypothetical protein
MKVDFAKFERSLPYASELYGIYQPLLGWKSRLRLVEITAQLDDTKLRLLKGLQLSTTPTYDTASRKFQVGIGQATVNPPRSALDGIDGIVARKVSELVAAAEFKPEAWTKYTSEAALLDILADSRQEIESEVLKVVEAIHSASGPALKDPTRTVDAQSILESILQRESKVAGALHSLGQERSAAEIASLMMPAPAPALVPFLGNLGMITPGQSDLADATLSPIGLIRLYRQYFFEFDTFLGPPVEHLWLSPGGAVELVEVSTRRTLVEQSTEQALESSTKSERSSTDEQELSDAIRSENSDNTKLGVTLTSTGNYTVGFVSGSTQLSTSYNVEKASKEAREDTHRSLRQQTEKLSSEIRKNFKSTFKTVTETTDTQSRRYVIQNKTKKLINYELRRKMRQVGVQVQDYGLHLCWQAYVDNPAAELGIAKLVHIAAPADLQGIQEPEAPAMPEPEIREKPLPVPEMNIHDVPGTAFEANKFYSTSAELHLTPPQPDYIYSHTEVIVTGHGEFAQIRAYPRNADEAVSSSGIIQPNVEMIPTGDPADPVEPSVQSIVLGFELDTLYVQTNPLADIYHYWNVDVVIVWKPSRKLIRDKNTAYTASMAKFTAATARANKAALYKDARDRVAVASKIKPRPFAELRDEERIVVYRNLIGKLLTVAGITDPSGKTNEDPKLRHVFAEVVESMFDVEKMLYFVAPEWWRPRRYATSRQNIGLQQPPMNKPAKIGRVVEANPDFDSANTIDWNGGANRPSSYYITEDSAPARMGSSLGWLLQLDGDNNRNAFLNAPWVKAVIPIRAEHEWTALAWLSNPAIEGSEGLEDTYEAPDAEKQKILTALKSHIWDDPALTDLYAAMKKPDQVRIIDAIRYLILHVQELHRESLTPVPDPDEPTMSYLPTDEVFEHGFDPLQGGFKATGPDPKIGRFKPFDQWVEVLPTDQIVPVEVKYDPITGMQI